MESTHKSDSLCGRYRVLIAKNETRLREMNWKKR